MQSPSLAGIAILALFLAIGVCALLPDRPFADLGARSYSPQLISQSR